MRHCRMMLVEVAAAVEVVAAAAVVAVEEDTGALEAGGAYLDTR